MSTRNDRAFIDDMLARIDLVTHFTRPGRDAFMGGSHDAGGGDTWFGDHPDGAHCLNYSNQTSMVAIFEMG